MSSATHLSLKFNISKANDRVWLRGGFRHRFRFTRNLSVRLVSIHNRKHPANLLVVFLLVELYKLEGARSSEILSPVWRTSPQAAEGQRSQPRRHDFLRLFRETLAADRSGKANHCDDAAED